MHTHNPLRLLAVACLAAVTLPCFASAQTTVYRETFANTSGSNATYASVGWSWYWNTTTTTAVNRSAQTTGSAVGTGTPAGTASTNVGQTAGGAASGFGFFGGTNVTAHFGFTTEYNGASPQTSDLSAISFVQGNSAAIDFRVALRVNNGTGDAWYVSASQAGTTVATGADFLATPVKLTFADFSSANWSALNFSPTSPLAMSIGASGLLPTGTITGFGIYATTAVSGATGRMDDFTVAVSAIPEPSTFSALAGLGVLGLAASRRRRR